MFKKLENYIERLDTTQLTEERKALMRPLVTYIQSKFQKEETIRLNFICTHNSRRSHLGQVWAQTMAKYYDIKSVQTYSGGTEATAMFPQIIKTLQKVGFHVYKISESSNPIYLIRLNEDDAPMLGFSKVYNHFYNPKNDYAVVMTCDHADENCPFIPGADSRINLTYQDPKIADNTTAMEKVYLERSQQIATEMKYLFSKI